MLSIPLAPDNASTFATKHDLLFYLITGLTVFFTLIVFALVLGFTIKYRAGSKANRANASDGNVPMELAWSGLPLVLGLGIFFISTKLFIEMRTMPKNAMEISVVGKQWMWHMQHPNGIRENNTLHVPVGKPIKLTMISQDVIHAFYVPEFRMQYMVVPGRYTDAWFQPTKVGTFHIFCNMYCGTQHSEMGGTVVVMEPEKFQQWLKEGGNDAAPMSLEERGEKIFNKIGCGNCHAGNSTERAPTLVGIYGTTRAFTDGSTAVANEDYLRRAILRPLDQLNKGYGPTMPMYQGQISEEDTLALIAYMKRNTGGMTNMETEAAKGQPGTGAAMIKEPVSSVGAIQDRENRVKPQGGVTKGNLSVGAISARKQ